MQLKNRKPGIMKQSSVLPGFRGFVTQSPVKGGQRTGSCLGNNTNILSKSKKVEKTAGKTAPASQPRLLIFIGARIGSAIGGFVKKTISDFWSFLLVWLSRAPISSPAKNHFFN